jgi:hypothetical protein
MKQLLVLFIAAFTSTIISAQTPSEIFSRYSGEENVVHLKMNGSMFNSDSEKYKSDIDDIEVLVVPKDHMKARVDLESFSKVARSSNYDTLMEVVSGNDRVEVFSKGSGDEFSSIIVNVFGDDNLVLVRLDGRIFKSDLDKIDFNSDGANFLNQLK